MWRIEDKKNAGRKLKTVTPWNDKFKAARGSCGIIRPQSGTQAGQSSSYPFTFLATLSRLIYCRFLISEQDIK